VTTLQGNANATAVVFVQAFSANDAIPTTQNDPVSLDGIVITDSNNNDVTNTITITQVNDGYVLEGIKAGYEITVTADSGFNALQITNYNSKPDPNGGNFSGSNFRLLQSIEVKAVSEQVDLSLELDTLLTDEDGDKVADDLVINFKAPTPPSVDNTEVVVDEGEISGFNEFDSSSLNFTAGTNALTSFAFADSSNISVDTNLISGADISWVEVNPSTIEGYVDGNLAIILELTPPASSIASGLTDSASVKATLISNLHHPDGDGENVIALNGVKVVATSSTGETVSGNVTVTVIDDIPIIDDAHTACVDNA